jgi:hypothetical protein
MSKAKMLLIAVCVLLLLGVSLWLYWETDLPLMEQIPDEQWAKLEISVGDPGEGDTKIDPPALESVLTAIADTQVTRHSEIRGLSYPYFRLLLYKGEAYPTLIYVQENGWVTIAEELDFDHYRYYEGGEELYQALLKLTA